MKVVVDALSARSGGGQTYLRSVLAHDPPEGVVVRLFATKELPVFPVGRGIEVVRLPHRFAKPARRTLWVRASLRRHLLEGAADVLFCPGGVIGTSAPPGCAVVTMCRNVLPFDRVQRRRYPIGYTRARIRVLEPVLLRSMRRADLVIFVSEHGRELVRSRLGSTLGAAVVIRHGVGDDFRPGALSNRPGWLPPEYLLYVSNLEPYKRQVEVVRAFAALQRRRRGAESLVLVGPASAAKYASAVGAEVRRHGLEDRVVIAGSLDHHELPAVYRHAKVGIFASECENCPNVLLEGMASGRAMVVSSRPPMPEFAGSAVAYFDPRQPEELAVQLAQLLDDPARRDELGEAAAVRARNFDWSHTAGATWAAFQRVVDGQ